MLNKTIYIYIYTFYTYTSHILYLYTHIYIFTHTYTLNICLSMLITLPRHRKPSELKCRKCYLFLFTKHGIMDNVFRLWIFVFFILYSVMFSTINMHFLYMEIYVCSIYFGQQSHHPSRWPSVTDSSQGKTKLKYGSCFVVIFSKHR